jgi:hypothetical protein
MMALQLRFAMHLRMDHGSAYVHDFVDESGKVVGHRSSFTPRGRYAAKHPAKTVYRLGEREFATGTEFLKAYHEEQDDGRKQQD